MTEFLESRLPPGDNTTLIEGINRLTLSHIAELEGWIKRNEEKLGGMVELHDVDLMESGRGFEASFIVGCAFPDVKQR